MIILNHCKEPNEIIHYGLHKKSLTPILYAKRVSVVAKYYEIVLHSLQQLINGVGHSGCHDEITQYSKVTLLKTETKPEYKSLRQFFFQPVKSLLKAKVRINLKMKSLRFWFGKRGVCYYKRL